MKHNPLCSQQPRPDGNTLTMSDGVPIFCLCDLIDKVRQDMLAKCIAAVQALFGPENYELRWLLDGEAVLTALRALEEKP